jgi:hypothetical protein
MKRNERHVFAANDACECYGRKLRKFYLLHVFIIHWSEFSFAGYV